MDNTTAVTGTANALVPVPETLIEANQGFLARQHQAVSPGTARVFDDGAHEAARPPLPSAPGVGAHAEQHLPRAALVMHGRVRIHGIDQIRLVGDHAVDGRRQPVVVEQQPEMVGVCAQPVGDGVAARRLRRRKAFGFERCQRIQIAHIGVPYHLHGFTVTALCRDRAVRENTWARPGTHRT